MTNKAEIIYGIGAWGGIIAMSYMDTPKGMIICSMVSMGSWLLYLSARQDDVNRRLQESIDRLWERMNPPVYQDTDYPA